MKTENKRFKHYSIVLNGEHFQVVGTMKDSYDYSSLRRDQRWTYSNIWEAYGRPSDTKESIWQSWLAWSNEIDDCEIWVQSKNCHFFTICGKVRYTDSACEVHAYFLHITASHNYAYEIEPF